jgi:hypothetical protein
MRIGYSAARAPLERDKAMNNQLSTNAKDAGLSTTIMRKCQEAMG